MIWHTERVSCDPNEYGVPTYEYLDLPRGDTVVLPFLIEEMADPEADPDDPATVWQGRDLSGGAFSCQVRSNSAEGPLWVTPVIDDSGAATGSFTVTLGDTTSAVPGVDYVGDVEYVEGGVTETLLGFLLRFDSDVTREA